MKIYFYPGLGADSFLARFHSIPGFDIQWIGWPRVFGDTWEDFIRNIKSENRIENNAIHAGISFGGLVAQRMACDFEAEGVILIGSLSSGNAIAGIFRMMRAFVRFIPAPLFSIRLMPRFLIRYYFGIRKRAELDLFYAMARKLNGGKVKTLIRFIPAAERDARPGCPTLRVHGSLDRILPVGNQAVDFAVDGGGHLISMTHAEEINARVSEWLEWAAGEENPGSRVPL